eukprot:COSAG04_NODE_12_length_42844_cov_6.769213_13_plen_141_part_00
MGDDAKQNPMKELQVEKLILNISVGTSGDPLEKARRVLKQLTGLDGSEGQEPVRRRSALRRGAAPRPGGAPRGGFAAPPPGRAMQGNHGLRARGSAALRDGWEMPGLGEPKAGALLTVCPGCVAAVLQGAVHRAHLCHPP